MLFDVENARYLSQEYERRVSANHWQRTLRTAQSRPNALVRLVDQGLRLADTAAMTLWRWGQNVNYSVRWLLATNHK